jgi:hypothetical protein
MAVNSFLLFIINFISQTKERLHAETLRIKSILQQNKIVPNWVQFPKQNPFFHTGHSTCMQQNYPSFPALLGELIQTESQYNINENHSFK